MANTVERAYPDTIFITPDMEAPPQVRSMGRGMGYTMSMAGTGSPSGTKSRSFGGSTMMGSTLSDGRSQLDERDILYKHKRQYASDFPPLADRHHPEWDAKERRMIKETEAAVMRKKAEGEDEDEAKNDPECRFKPRSLQQPVPVHPEYASGKSVSSTYAMCGQVSYLPPDTTKRIRTAQSLNRKRAEGLDDETTSPATAGSTRRKTKTSPYAVTTWSSFAAAAAPAVEPGDKLKSRSFGSPSAGKAEGGSPYAPPKKSERPPLRIAIHPTRY